jgi:Pentapeptide repeats (8 copies)
LLVLLCVLGVAGLAVVLLWPVTDMIATHDVGTITGAARAADLQTAHEAVRTQLLTLGAGVFAAGALAFTALNFRLSRQQFQQSGQQFVEQLELSRRAAQDSAEAERRTLELTEQGQVTDRYTKAIEQLGSDKLNVRIGGIYALERIARDSARDHPTVMEVLSAFIREHSRERSSDPEAEEVPQPEDRPQPADDPEAEEDQWIWITRIRDRGAQPDVQAAATVLGRRDAAQDRQPIDWKRVDLSGAYLTNADLRGADFWRANLVGAWFTDASLAGARFVRADLSWAFLAGADLANANFAAANLFHATLRDVDLRDANLNGANLRNANLRGADLTGASLDFDPDLTAAILTDVKWPDSAPVPSKWIRDPDSHRLRRAPQEETDA